MLDALRKGAGTWVAKIFIALLVLSFAVWGIADIFRGFGQNVAAKVGNTEISLFAFDRAYRRDLSQLGQQIGRTLSTTEGAQFGVPQQTLGKLVAQAALNETATNMDLGISDARLGRLIQDDPAFQRPGGGYDRAKLQQVLRNNGMTEDEFVIERRQLSERQQLAEGISGAMNAPTVYLELLHSYQSETRDLKYLLLAPALLGDIADPDEETLKAYFEDEKAKFRAPEYRKVTLLEVSPTVLAQPDDISDDDARAEYDRDLQRYHQPERRKVRQLSFTTPEDAADAAAKIAAGKTFDDLMADMSLSHNDVYLGLMAKDDFLDNAIGDAAFELEEGATSDVIKGRFSSVILNIMEVQPEKTKPFEEVRDEIKAQLAKEAAEREVLDLLDEIEDARAGGALLNEVSERFQLKTQSPEAFDASGKGLDDNKVTLPDADGLVAGVFDSDVGVENDPLQLGDRGFLWYEVTEVIPARDRELAEVRDQVVAAWKKQETEKRLKEKAKDLAEKAKAGADLAVQAEEAGVEVKTATGVSRGRGNGDINTEAANIAFTGPAGSVFEVAAADGISRLVLKVEAANTPDFDGEAADIKSIEAPLASQLRDSLLNQYVAHVETTAGVQINDAGIAQVLGLSRN